MKCKVCKRVSVKKIAFVIIVLTLLTVNIDFCFAQTENQAEKRSAGLAEEPGVVQPEHPPLGPTPPSGPMSQEPYPSAEPMRISEQPTPSPPEQVGLESKAIPVEEITEGVKVSKERISLDLKGIDIVELFKVLSLKMGFTIVPSKGVTGRVNIFLNNLTFEDTLDVILISQDLACERKENIINIMTAAEYERLYGKKYNEKRKFKSLKLTYAKPATVFNALSQIKSDIGKIIVDEATGTILLIDIPEKLALMQETAKDLDKSPQTEVFDIKYAKTADMKTHLSTAITTGPGELLVDERSSKVVVSDLPEKMKKIKRIVKAFDEETRQVFIEAEIIEILLNRQFQRGVDWEKIFTQERLNGLDFVGKFPVAALSAYQKISMGTLASDKYTMVLDFLKTYGDTKILARPRLAVINNQEAKILVGRREPYATSAVTSTGDTSITSYTIDTVEIGTKLYVVPTINQDNFITMKIKPEVSSVTRYYDYGPEDARNSVPIVETSEAETLVKVKDGTMIMIAGLMKEEKRDDVLGVPLLSKIPFIGALFGTRTTQTRKSELVVFITPHIITGDVTLVGTEPEKMIPPDIVPEDMKKEIISRKVEEIKVKPKETKIEEERVPLDISTKMKGIKEY